MSTISKEYLSKLKALHEQDLIKYKQVGMREDVIHKTQGKIDLLTQLLY